MNDSTRGWSRALAKGVDEACRAITEGVLSSATKEEGMLMIRKALGVSLFGLVMLAGGRPAAAQTESAYETALRPGDVLRISVWPDTGLGGEFPVEADGNVYLPFLGSVPAVGVPVDDLRARIREGFQSAQRNAVVTVTPLYRIGVTGAVERSGLYLVPPTDRFFDVIANAGGFQPGADQSKVTVVRDGQVLRLNAEEALKTGDTLPLDALSLKSGDQVVVPFSGQPWRARDYISLLNIGISIAILVDRLQN
jgi:protein involved in polysaccharide export with SLBB domain